MPTIARGDDAPPAGGLEEIVVTAQRRSEKAQDVPISISAVTSDKLESMGVGGIEALPMAIPSLNIGNGNGYLVTHLRGIGTLANGPGIENPVALYVDGVYYANQTVGLFSFNNISQIEVLKGPQGTLFGRNATGGLISVTTAEPTQTFQLRTSVGASNYQGADGAVYVAGGLAPNLAADLAVEGKRRDGWGRNEVTGDDVNAVRRDVALRSKWIYDPGDLKLTMIGDYSNVLSSTNTLGTPSGTYAVRGLTPLAEYSQPYDVATNTQPQIEQVNYGGSLKAEYHLSEFNVANTAAYRRAKLNNLFDYDGTALPLVSVDISQPDLQVSDELQFTSQSSGPLQWVAGAYYFNATSQIDPNTVFFADEPELNPNYPLNRLFIYGRTRTKSISGYGQGTYNFTDQLALTAGVRYSSERRDFDASEAGQLLVPGNPVIGLVAPIAKSDTFSDPTYRVALSYKPIPDSLVYVSWNTGFKSGGFNTTTPTDPGFKPEKLSAIEVGEKTDFLDHSLRVNAAGFFYRYKDIQTQIPEATGTGIINGAVAHLYGVDTDVTYIPVRNLELVAALSWLHTEYLSFPGAPFSTPGGGVPVFFGNATGNQLPYSARVTADLSPTYTLNVGNNRILLNAAYSYNSGFYFESDNVARQRAFSLYNASATWKTSDDHYSVMLYGNNLANKATESVIITLPSGEEIGLMAPPRTYGARFTYKY